MGSTISEELFLRKAMKPALRELSEQCNEAISASILEYNEIRYIARFESREVLRVSVPEGTRFPAHCTATGKILLSALSDDYLKKLYNTKSALVSCTNNSITSFKKLSEVLKRVRKEGVAYDFEEAVVGVKCVARPVRRKDGEVVAAISISGPVSRMTKEKMLEFSQLLLNTTTRMSREFGFVDVSKAHEVSSHQV
jgi:DNA-binding IclR family transcriptional regulator